MIRIVLVVTGNAVTYEASNKPEDTSKSGQKRVYFPNDKDRSRSDSSKRPKDDARKDGHDSRKYANVMMLIEMPSIVNAVSPSMEHVQHLYTYCLIRELTLSHSLTGK